MAAVTSFSRNCRNFTPPPPRNASSDSAIPASTSMDSASTRRLRKNSTTLQAIGGADEASRAFTSPTFGSSRL
jgi:hypothetical protein